MNKVQPTWIYIIGTLVFFGALVLFAKDIFIPRLFSLRNYDTLSNIQSPKINYLSDNLDYLAKITTSEGTFTVQLFEASAPKNVNNFIYLSKNSYYNQTTFHRMIPNLLIQGGDRNTLNKSPEDDGFGKTNYFIEDEVNWQSLNLTEQKITELESLGYKSNNNVISSPIQKYSILMANTGPNTNSAQFFIILSENSDSRIADLEGKFTVIGIAVDGEETLNKIALIPVDDANSNTPRLTRKVQILSVEIFNK